MKMLPYKHPSSWNEVAINYDAMIKQIEEEKEEIAKRHPEKRQEIVERLKPLEQDLTRIQASLERIKSEYFVDENGKITELGKVGRWLSMSTILQHLYVVIGELEILTDVLRCDWAKLEARKKK